MTEQTDTQEVADDVRDDVDDAASKHQAKLLKELKEARAKARELEAFKAEKEAEAERAQEEADKKAGEFAKLEAKLKGEADGYKTKYESLVSDRALTDALVAAKIDDTYKPAVRALLKEKGVSITKDGEAQIEGQPVADYVKAWAESDAGKPFILSGNSGGGANGGGSKSSDPNNPWREGPSFNRMEQSRIRREDPDRALRLQKEAGV